MRKLWPFSFYFCQFAGIAFLLPYFVLYYQSRRFSGLEIGVLAGLMPVLALISAPLWTGLADATRRHRLVLSLALAMVCLLVPLFPALQAFGPVLVLVVVYSIFNAPISALVDSASMTLLGSHRDHYGRLRLGGTLGFALAGPIAGQLVQRYGLNVSFWGYAAMYLMALVVSQKIWSPAGSAAAAGRAAVASGSWALMTNPRWLLFLAGAFAGGLALIASNTYLFAYFKELGANESTMGLALTLSTVLEVPVLFFGHRLLRRLGAARVFWTALVIMSARLLLNAAASTMTQALLIQLLVGVAFPMMWLGGVAYAAESAPKGLSATAQGMFWAALAGVGSAVGGLTGGLLLASFGAHSLFLAFGLAVLTVVVVATMAGRLLPSAGPAAAISPET